MSLSEQELAKLWETFVKGDHLSDADLTVLIQSAEEGLRYLRARGEHLAASRTCMDLESLRGFEVARRRRD